MTDPSGFTTWRKSHRSGGADNCVEIAVAVDGTVGVRDSKDPTGPVLRFTPDEWTAFISGVRDGDFDPGQRTADVLSPARVRANPPS